MGRREGIALALERRFRRFIAVFPCQCNCAVGGNLHTADSQFAHAVQRFRPLLDIAACNVLPLAGIEIDGIAAVKRSRIRDGNMRVIGIFCQQRRNVAVGAFQQGLHLGLALLVGAGQAGAGQNVMELVDQQRGDIARNSTAVHGCAIGSGLLGGQEFQVVDVALCQTVVALDGVLVRQRAAVQFQIELAAVFRHIVGGRFQLLHKVAHQHVFGAGHALQIFFAAGHLDHLKLGAAAAVTEAVGNQPLVGDGLFADAVIAVHNVVGQRLGVGPDVGLIQVGEHLCTVDALPQEGIIRKGRRIVPRHLRG